MSSETGNVVLKGHAYRPRRNPYGRNVFPECECGQLSIVASVNSKTARYIHREHKKAIIRETGTQ